MEDERFKKLEDYLTYLREWKEEVAALSGYTPEEKAAMLLSPQTLRGIEMTVRGFKGALDFLLSPEVGTKFIMARVFCQDNLEQYFSQQRAACGGSNNPDKLRFMHNMNNKHIHGQLGIKKRKGNTEDIDGRELPCTPLRKRSKIARKCLVTDFGVDE